MERPGRNGPCPCGSGRKYKKCCLPHEAQRTAFAAVFEAFGLPLLGRLARYAESAAGMPLDRVAREHFPFWRGRLDKAQGARVVDYLIFEHRPQHFGRRTVEQFALEAASALSDDARAMLQRWVDAPRRLYRADVWSGGFTTIADLLSPELPPVDVYDVEGSWRPSPGVAVAVRALPVTDDAIFTGPPIVYPARPIDEVVDAIRRRHLDFVRTQRIVGIDDFLRLNSTAFDEEAMPRSSVSTIVVPGA